MSLVIKASATPMNAMQDDGPKIRYSLFKVNRHSFKNENESLLKKLDLYSSMMEFDSWEPNKK